MLDAPLAQGGAPALPDLGAVTPIAAELCDLKRLRDASSPDSLASRLFRAAWGALAAGEPADEVALTTSARALAALRLGGIDAELLARLGLEAAAAGAVLGAAFDQVAGPIEPGLAARLRARLARAPRPGPVPDFVEALIRQPRAGATCPGKPRLVLEPPELHGDHCLAVAVLGTLLAPRFGAPAGRVFLAGMAHHLHNAVLPDSGFAGETLLGPHLEPVMRRLFAEALSVLPAPLGAETRVALDAIQDASGAAGRAFHAADVIDRVLTLRHFERVAAFTLDQALDEMDLVHAGPVQAFHQAVLRRAGLA